MEEDDVTTTSTTTSSSSSNTVAVVVVVVVSARRGIQLLFRGTQQHQLTYVTLPNNNNNNKNPIPLHVWTGPEGSSRLRLPDFKTIGT